MTKFTELTQSTPDGAINYEHLATSPVIARNIEILSDLLSDPRISWIDPNQIVIDGRNGTMIYCSEEFERKHTIQTEPLVLKVVNNLKFAEKFPDGIIIADQTIYVTSDLDQSDVKFDISSRMIDGPTDVLTFQGLNFFSLDYYERSGRSHTPVRLVRMLSQIKKHGKLLSVEELEEDELVHHIAMLAAHVQHHSRTPSNALLNTQSEKMKEIHTLLKSMYGSADKIVELLEQI